MSEKWWLGRITVYLNKGMNEEEAREQVLKDMREKGSKGGKKGSKDGTIKGFAITGKAREAGRKGSLKRWSK